MISTNIESNSGLCRSRPTPANAKRVGVEIEFTGLQIEEIVDIIIAELGGKAETVSDYEVNVVDGPLGRFGVELDFAYIKKLSRERRQRHEHSEIDELTENVVGAIAKKLVPFEVVGPPVAMPDLWQLESLFKALREAGAEGTGNAATNAFGLQLNPEMPNCKAATILNYMRAFLCLFDWLKMRSAVDLTRRLTSYVDPFGKDYVRHILRPDYQPDIATLIDDYLHYNPTRNRALDMLPLFAHLDEQRVRDKVKDERVKARPTLHYRLPNSLIDDPQWGLIHPWRDWLQVDNLANRPEALTDICQAYRKRLDSLTGGLFGDWQQEVSRWLIPELL